MRLFFKVGPVSDVPTNGNKCFDIEGVNILICHHGGNLFALRNECPHAKRPLEGGPMRRGIISCPIHGAQFELRTGKNLSPPALESVETYPLKVENDFIFVQI